MEDTLVSIVVPIYGVEKYICQCVDSLLSQTYRNIEIILVDDGSKDNCPNICDEYAKKDLRIHVIHKNNGGLVSARKAGVREANGKFIEFVDGDDWVSEHIVEALVDTAENKKADIVMCNYYEAATTLSKHKLYTPSGDYVGEELKQLVDTKSLYGGTSDPHYQFGIEINVWNKLFKAELLKEVEEMVPDQISYGEDTACTMVALPKCHKLCVIDDPLYYYRINPESMSKAYSKNQTMNTIPLIQYLKKCFQNNNNLMKQLSYYHVSITMANIGNESREGSIKGIHNRYNNIRKYLKETDFKKSLSCIDRSKLSKRTNMMCSLIERHIFFLPFLVMNLANSRKVQCNA